MLDGCGLRLGSVVRDINGVTAQRLIAAVIEGRLSPAGMAELASGRLAQKKEALQLALEGEVSDRHRFLLQRLSNHIKWLQEQVAELDDQSVAAREPYQREWQRLQTIPGLDRMGAAMLLAEIGTARERFGSAARLSAWAGMCPGNQESAGKKKRSHRARQ